MELAQYLKGVLRWWWLILISTAVAAGASYITSSRQVRIYQATTTLIVGQVIQKANPTGQDFSTTEQLAESYAQTATRQPVLQATVDSLDLNMNWQVLKSRVNAFPVPRTQLLAITVQDNSPKRAMVIADEIANQLILQSPTSPQNAQRAERSEFVHSQLDDLEARIEKAQARVQELDEELNTAFSARQIQDLESEIDKLEKLINGWQTTYTNLLDFLEGGDSSPNYLSIIEPAQLPTKPVSPNILLNVMLASLVGFVLSLSVALLLEYLDDTFKSTDDLSAALGLTVLGHINRIEGAEYADKLITVQGPFSPVSEAYRLVRTNIQSVTTAERPAKSIMVTSPNPGEGKSVISANLGVIMAQASLKTIIIDADMRRPVQHKIFSVSNLEGLSDLLNSPRPEIDDYLKHTGIENLQIITSGPLPPNSSELLGSSRMIELLRRLETMADVVILDSPPVLAVTDATVLSNKVGGVILVAQAKRTRRNMATQTLERLHRVGANVLGAVLNRAADAEKDYYRYYAYTRRGPSIPAQAGHSSLLRRWWQRLPVLK